MTIPNPAVIMITGASSGIGSALVNRLAAPGRTLHLQGRDRTRLMNLAESVHELGGVAVTHSIDLSDHEAVDGATRRLTEELPRLDALVHSAGAVALDEVADARIEELDRLYAINVRAPFALTTALTPALVAATGQVVFVNSGLGRQSRPGWSQYAITKFGLRALADAYRSEIENRGVRVMTVYPGRTATPMQAEVYRNEGREYQPENCATADDVAGCIEHGLEMPRSAIVQEMTVRQRGVH